MVNFFKNFGKGVLYVLVLPFLLVGLAIYGVVAFFIFVFLAFKGIILFFTGRSLYEDLPEDIEAKKRLNGQPTAEQTQVTNEDISSALNSSKPEEQAVNTADPFYVPEYLKQQQEEHEEIIQEEIKEPEQEAPVLEEQEQLVEEAPKQEEDLLFKPSFVNEADDQLMQEDEILLEKTEQKSNILEIKGDDEDEEESSGVNIDFE